MKIVVMGSGVIGVTSAYFLARKGFEVTVLEKNNTCAQGCSYANGGQLSYSHIEPFSSNSSASLILKALLKPNSFLKISDLRNKEFLKWSFEFLKNCSNNKSNKNSQKLFSLGKCSKEALSWLMKEEPNLNFNYSKKGILHFYRSDKLFKKAIKQSDLQKTFGDKIRVLSAEECIKLEPSLLKIHNEKKLAGGIFHEEDASGNSFEFVNNLAKICQEKYGVIFEYNTEIKNIFTNYKKITGIHTSKGVFVADNYVYALGAYGSSLLKGIKIDPKIYPMKGYSLSIPANAEYSAPQIALTDPENKIVYSRIGNIFRAAGTIEACGFNADHNQSRIGFLKSKISSTFSNYGNIKEADEWSGFRPFRPNSIPLICNVEKYGNLYLNAGHGHLGFTMSSGSAKILSDLIEGKNVDEFAFLKEEKYC